MILIPAGNKVQPRNKDYKNNEFTREGNLTKLKPGLHAIRPGNESGLFSISPRKLSYFGES